MQVQNIRELSPAELEAISGGASSFKCTVTEICDCASCRYEVSCGGTF